MQLRNESLKKFTLAEIRTLTSAKLEKEQENIVRG